MLKNIIIRLKAICFGCGKTISLLESIAYDGYCKECYKKANG